MRAPLELGPVPAMTWQRAAIRDDRLTARTVPIVAALTTLAPGRQRSHAADRLDFFASVPTLMELSRLGDRAVRLALDDLLRLGYLLKVKRGGRQGQTARATVWRMTLPVANAAADAGWETPPNAAADAGWETPPNAAADAGWEPVDNWPEPVDNPVPNRHEGPSQPAPADSPRACTTKSEAHHTLGASRTERARELRNGDEAPTDPEMRGAILTAGGVPSW